MTKDVFYVLYVRYHDALVTSYITADTCDVVKEVSADVQGVSGELFLIYASNIIH